MRGDDKMIYLQDIKREVLKLKEQYDKCEIGTMEAIGAAIEINGKFERAADRGQKFISATVRPMDKDKGPMKCIWLEDGEPDKRAAVEIINVFDVLMVAFYKTPDWMK